jgi:hypothetical protein
MYANAGRLFANALNLHRGLSSLNPASEQAQRDSLASVIFSVLSTEAFINELAQLACGCCTKSRGTELGQSARRDCRRSRGLPRQY